MQSLARPSYWNTLWSILAAVIAILAQPRQLSGQSGLSALEECIASQPQEGTGSYAVTFCEDFGRVGCSLPPHDAPAPYDVDWTPYVHIFYSACKRHDQCYRYGWQTYGKQKSDCDDEFWSRLHDNCTNPDEEWYYDVFAVLTMPECLAMAGLFYGGVVLFGGSSYRTMNGSCCPYAKALNWHGHTPGIMSIGYLTVDTVVPTQEPCKTAWLSQDPSKAALLTSPPMHNEATLFLLVLH